MSPMWLTAAVMLPLHRSDACFAAAGAEALGFSTNVKFVVVTQLGIYNL